MILLIHPRVVIAPVAYQTSMPCSNIVEDTPHFSIFCPSHNTDITHDDGDDDVTIGWYVDNAHLPIETHIPTYCNVILLLLDVVLRKVRINLKTTEDFLPKLHFSE